MRSFALLSAVLAAATSVVAAPSGAGQGYCLCEKEAMAVATNVEKLFADYSNELALNVLTKEFQDETDSVQFIMNNGTLDCPKPLSDSTFTSRKNLIQVQSIAGNIPWANQEVFWDCKRVFIRYHITFEPFPVQGIAIFETAKNPKASPEVPYLISQIYSEFNSGAWLADLAWYRGVGFAPGCVGVPGAVGNLTIQG